MRIKTDTPDLLIVEERPVLLGVLLVVFILVFVGGGLNLAFSGDPKGLLFALLGGGMGGAAFVALVRRVQVVFHRPGGYVEIRRRNVFGGARLRHDLAEIDRAVIEESNSSDGGTTRRVALVIETGQSAGHHPLTLAYSSGSGHQRAAEAINRWLAAGRAPR